MGYAQASQLGVNTFSGQSVAPTDALIRYTLAGDANLDSKVDLTDFTYHVPRRELQPERQAVA